MNKLAKILLLSSYLYLPLVANEEVLKQNSYLINEAIVTNHKLAALANEINYQSKLYDQMKKQYDSIDQSLEKNKQKLKFANETLQRLLRELKQLREQIATIQSNIIDEITNTYSASIGLELSNQPTPQEIIDKEIYTLLIKISKFNIKRFNQLYIKLAKNDKIALGYIEKYKKFIDQENKKRLKLLNIVAKKEKILNSLIKDKQMYQKKLQDIIAKQKELSSIIDDLDITNSGVIEKVDNTNNDLVTKYNGAKTIAPLVNYTITKQFGFYKDTIYNNIIFNKSITMKIDTQEANVYNILNGKIIKIKRDSQLLKNTIVIKHRDNIHTIYSNIDNINENLKIGDRVRKGKKIGTINNKLIFQVIKGDKYIDPMELFE